ncbi:hemolysin family protein [Nocardioides caldifontis]|uniref:hemolysin family protein n=1 Tax=Nocardioides caldifontis TaxID=2588938 RepID=UPI0011E03DB3|nr:hemolysin family protein [Nocardioides caldifontis]
MTELLLLAVAVLLVAACGMFVAAEFSLVTADRSAVERAADAGDKGAVGVRAARRSLSTQLSGAQVGITVTNLAIGFLAEPAIAALVEEPLLAVGVAERAVPGIAVGVGLVLATAATMVFGELVPKNLAIAEPLEVARATQRFQRGFTAAMRLPIRFLNGSANALVRRLGVEPQEELRSARSAEELASLIDRSAAEGTLESRTARLMARSVAFGDRIADDIMTPRVQMSTVPANAPVEALVELARRTGHSRFPVTGEDVDDVVGAVHVKHAVAVPVGARGERRVAEVMVEPTVVPATLELDPLLEQLRGEGLQLAVVIDEYGGTAGVVTLEDVVEEIVGDIADEHDRLGARARRRRDGSWSLSGLLRPDEVGHLTGVPLPEDDDYDTVAGLVLHLLGRMPETGDEAVAELPPQLAYDDGEPVALEAVLRVERMDGLRIARVALSTRPAGDEEAGR